MTVDKFFIRLFIHEKDIHAFKLIVSVFTADELCASFIKDVFEAMFYKGLKNTCMYCQILLYIV